MAGRRVPPQQRQRPSLHTCAPPIGGGAAAGLQLQQIQRLAQGAQTGNATALVAWRMAGERVGAEGPRRPPSRPRYHRLRHTTAPGRPCRRPCRPLVAVQSTRAAAGAAAARQTLQVAAPAEGAPLQPTRTAGLATGVERVGRAGQAAGRRPHSCQQSPWPPPAPHPASRRTPAAHHQRQLARVSAVKGAHRRRADRHRRRHSRCHRRRHNRRPGGHRGLRRRRHRCHRHWLRPSPAAAAAAAGACGRLEPPQAAATACVTAPARGRRYRPAAAPRVTAHARHRPRRAGRGQLLGVSRTHAEPPRSCAHGWVPSRWGR